LSAYSRISASAAVGSAGACPNAQAPSSHSTVKEQRFAMT